MASQQWAPDHIRRQVMRQARYALNVAILNEDRVPPEGPFDVALTNGLLAIIAKINPTLVLDKKDFTLPASKLLPIAMQQGLSVDFAALEDGLKETQPLRHGRADDEWIRLGEKHIDALKQLDDFEGLEVLHHIASHNTVDDLMVTLYLEKAQSYAERDLRSLDEALLTPEPEECDECWRTTFVPAFFDDSGGTLSPGKCIACGFFRSTEAAEDLYRDTEYERRWQDN